MEIEYTKDDYLNSSKPFEEIYSIENAFEKEQTKTRLAEHAKSLGIKNFTTLYNKYERETNRVMGESRADNMSDFSDLPDEKQLNTGSWVANDYGVSRFNMGKEEVACPHPILPVMRLENVDEKEEKVEIAYKPGGVWKNIVVDRETIANKSRIIRLANFGVGVDSENARHLVTYFTEVFANNYAEIPAKKSVSRLGWIEEFGFSPYVDGLVFDGEDSFRSFYNSVKSFGNEDEWLRMALEIRRGNNVVPRILLAASFASALVGPCSGLPFFVHLWGGTETGKTVGLMLAASVWADPNMGAFIHTFNSTAVAQELSAGFVNSLPLMLDELQIKKDQKDFDQMIYQLSEGVGKNRGEKTGGLRKTCTWRNCIMTTGEQPITRSSSGGGAVNRIIEIGCADRKLFADPKAIVNTIRNNYGFAGRRFVEALTDESVMEYAISEQKATMEVLSQSDPDANTNATEKQSLAASLILVADNIAGKYVFDGDTRHNLGVEDIRPFLSTRMETDQNLRAFAWLLEWIASNQNNFISNGFLPSGEWYGKTDQRVTSIVKRVFSDECRKAGFNDDSFLDWLYRTGRLVTSDTEKKKCKTKVERINDKSARCVCVIMPDDEDMEKLFG